MRWTEHVTDTQGTRNKYETLAEESQREKLLRRPKRISEKQALRTRRGLIWLKTGTSVDTDRWFA